MYSSIVDTIMHSTLYLLCYLYDSSIFSSFCDFLAQLLFNVYPFSTIYKPSIYKPIKKKLRNLCWPWADIRSFMLMLILNRRSITE